jgi:hypothetical protein
MLCIQRDPRFSNKLCSHLSRQVHAPVVYTIAHDLDMPTLGTHVEHDVLGIHHVAVAELRHTTLADD